MGRTSWLFKLAMEDSPQFWWVAELAGGVNTIELLIFAATSLLSAS
jgi:hypothetical protein